MDEYWNTDFWTEISSDYLKKKLLIQTFFVFNEIWFHKQKICKVLKSKLIKRLSSRVLKRTFDINIFISNKNNKEN